MKLQNMTIIFIIIIIPIVVVLSYYIGLQIDTITMQNSYNTKLQEATKDSIEAFEINTLEFNSTFSKLADTRRKNVLASINTFANELANSLGVAGEGLERLQTYIPAIAYTMYDGYYIYSPEGENGEKILRPYSPYSARYVHDNIIDITVNYTLDNYMKVYGTIGIGPSNYKQNEGYLVVCDKPQGVEGISEVAYGSYKYSKINTIKYIEKDIKPETLTEQVYIQGIGVKEYQYLYDKDNNKVYWDGTRYFKVNTDNQQNFLEDYKSDPATFYSNTFRKICIPLKDSDGEWKTLKIYQALNPNGGVLDQDKFFEDINADGIFGILSDDLKNIINNCGYDINTLASAIGKDFSAINYCVESYVFTKWVDRYIKDVEVGDLQVADSSGNVQSLKNITDVSDVSERRNAYGDYSNLEMNEKIFEITDNNNPDPEANEDYQKSILATHKKDIIINKLEKNLARAIEANIGQAYDYRLPKLGYDEWEQALSNVSIIAFMQGMQIGLKYYNNYAIATSTLNREYVDPVELYFSGNDKYYHQRDCNQMVGSSYVGYRSADYVAKSYIYIEPTTGEEITKYYYLHDDVTDGDTDSEFECYNCLVNRSTYNKGSNSDRETEYYNALARERYIQMDSPVATTLKPDIQVEKTVNKDKVLYGESVEYTITVTNNGLVDEIINFLDYFEIGKIQNINIISNELNGVRGKLDELDDYDETTGTGIHYIDTTKNREGIWIERVTIPAKQTKKLVFTANIHGIIGNSVINTAATYSYTTGEPIKDMIATTTVEKKVIKMGSSITDQEYNIVLVLDHSGSMRNIEGGKSRLRKLYDVVSRFLDRDNIKELFSNPGEPIKSQMSIIHFSPIGIPVKERITNKAELASARNLYNVAISIWSTNYIDAFIKADKQFEKLSAGNNKKNVLIFLSDGSPTDPTGIITVRMLPEETPGKGPKYLFTTVFQTVLNWIPGLFPDSMTWFDTTEIPNILGDAIKWIKVFSGGNENFLRNFFYEAIKKDEEYDKKGEGSEEYTNGMMPALDEMLESMGYDSILDIFDINFPRAMWERILTLSGNIKSKYSADIYTISFGSMGAEYGLRQIASPPNEKISDYYGYAGDEASLEEVFDTITNNLTKTEGASEYISNGGIIDLTEIDKITSVEVKDNTAGVTKTYSYEYLKNEGIIFHIDEDAKTAEMNLVNLLAIDNLSHASTISIISNL